MIKRIKSIKQVGVFVDSNNARYDFGKFTVIYGLNIQGKTTLSDIFSAIGDDDIQTIIERRTIPHDMSKSQEIEVTFGEDGNSETAIFLTDKGWTDSGLKDKILVFDNDFIHQNLIAGYEVTRRNRESFTDFILGEEGVQLSDDIKKLKQNIREEKNEIRTLKELFPKSLNTKTLPKFLSMEIPEEVEPLYERKEQIEKDLENLNSTKAISELPEVEEKLDLDIFGEVKQMVNNINTLLGRSYTDINDDALNKVKEHIEQSMKSKGSANRWLQSGLSEHCDNEHCPFCSQNLDPVSDLIDSFKGVFNESFKTYTTEITDEVRDIKDSFNNIQQKNYASPLTDLITTLTKYQKYIDKLDLEINEDQIITNQRLLSVELKKLKEELEIKFEAKLNEPHLIIENIQIPEELKSAIEVLEQSIRAEELKLQKAVEKAMKLKSLSTKSDKELKSDSDALNKKLSRVRWQIIRFEQKENCDAYIQRQENVKELEKALKEKVQQLETQQSEYLEKYFEGVNRYYKKLGNGSFEIKKKTDDRGDKKVYYIDVVLNGKSLAEDEMIKLLSESEKRSLALAIFLSKLEYEDDKKKKILVFDDPVVSFDINRCTSTIDTLKKLKDEFNQVVVLCHYSLFVEGLLMNINSDSVFLHLKRNSSTAFIENLNTEYLLDSPLNKAMRNIIGFINRDHDNNILDDCRILIERFLEVKYMQIIIDNNINPRQDLKILIDNLKDVGALNDAVANNLQNKRENLNPTHHNFNDSSKIEDSRTYAQEVLDLLKTL